MIFSSLPYFYFFALYFIAYMVTPARYRLALIIAGSTFFYGYWRLSYVFLPYILTLMGYVGGVLIARAGTPRQKKSYLWLTVVALLLPLAFFKYTAFLLEDVLSPLLPVNWQAESLLGGTLALPLGISFITFTLISYVVDVYKGKYALEKNYFWLLGYILYFPQLIAGPILRPSELLPQLHLEKKVRGFLTRERALGFLIFTVGLAKKSLFADQIAPVIEPFFVADATVNFQAAVMALYGFAMQIYCDFSGYTDMAIGSALMLGVTLPKNFLRPYGATSVADFWRRWHMTLSQWLRDYLYIPLGGNRKGDGRKFANALVTMLLGGLWHGANWTFVIWGGLHGLLIAGSDVVGRYFPRLARTPDWLKCLVTFHLVALLWVIFRSPDFAVAGQIYQALFSFSGMADLAAWQPFIFPLVLMGVFYASHRVDTHEHVGKVLQAWPKQVLIPLVVMVWLIVITFGVNSTAEFIYFDF